MTEGKSRRRTAVAGFGGRVIVVKTLLIAACAGAPIPVMAQNAATGTSVAGSALANPYGGIALPTATTTTTTSAATTSTATAPTANTPGSSAASPGGSSFSGAAAATSSASEANGRSSTVGSNSAGSTALGRTLGTVSGGAGTGTSAAPAASTAPAWILCPPSAAGGEEPFVAGTDLGCAP